MEKLIKRYVVIISALSILASCAVTTRSTEGTSETFINTSEASSKFTSSTSPRSRSDSSPKVDPVLEYMRNNMARIQADMAVGYGEYLVTLAVLMKIPDAQKQPFYRMTKDKFYVLFPDSNTSAEQLRNSLYTELSHLPTP